VSAEESIEMPVDEEVEVNEEMESEPSESQSEIKADTSQEEEEEESTSKVEDVKSSTAIVKTAGIRRARKQPLTTMTEPEDIQANDESSQEEVEHEEPPRKRGRPPKKPVTSPGPSHDTGKLC
jgi:hypothetical protein